MYWNSDEASSTHRKHKKEKKNRGISDFFIILLSLLISYTYAVHSNYYIPILFISFMSITTTSFSKRILVERIMPRSYLSVGLG